MSTEKLLVGKVLVSNNLGGADQNMVKFTIKMHVQASLGAVRRPNFARADFLRIRYPLSALDRFSSRPEMPRAVVG